MKRISRFSLVPLVGIGIALLVVLWPMFRPGFFVTDDGEWMVIRLSAFYQSLAGGQFPVRFLGRLNNSYGYPVANFLYPGFLYIGSLIRLMGASFPDAVKMILGGSVAGAAILLYGSLRKSYTQGSSVVGTVSFVMAPYLLFDVYTRGSVGEVLALFAAQLCVFAVVWRLPLLLSLGVALLIVSHNTAAVILMPGILAYILTEKTPRRLSAGFLLGIGMAAFFWIPALAEGRFVRFGTINIADPMGYFISSANAGLLGWVTALSLGVGIRMRRAGTTPREFLLWAFVLLGMLMSLPVAGWVWRSEVLTRLVQFPYRFLLLPVAFGPWVVAYAVEHVRGWHKAALIGVFFLIWVVSLPQTFASIRYIERPLGYYTTNEATTDVAYEYMPKWVSVIPAFRPVETLEILRGDATLQTRTFQTETMRTRVIAREASIIEINKIYYPGWGAAVDGVLVALDYRNPNGVMRVEIPKGEHTLTVQFRETPLRFLSDIVSLISVVAAVVFLRRR